MYVVTRNNPYYPDVTYCATLKAAQKRQREYFEEHNAADGDVPLKVTIAKVIETLDGRCFY